MKKLFITLGMLTCLFLFSPLANAAVITFDGLAGIVGSPYTENGFTLTAEEDSSFYAFDASEDWAYTGSAALINDYTTATTLTSADGSLFNFFSIDLSEAFSDVAGATPITFTAVYADSTTYSMDLITDGVFGYENFTFSGEFQNLVSVSFGDDSYFQFDNITASPVPEPSTLLLLGLGIAFLAAGRRGKK